MGSKFWHEVERLSRAALALPDGERARFLKEACGTDDDLRREVELRLTTSTIPTSFLRSPAIVAAAQALAEEAGGPNDLSLEHVTAASQTSVTLDSAASAASLTLRPGLTLSHYRLERYIGGGGMGVVWKAQDTVLKRPVAIKFLHESTADLRTAASRFYIEAQAAAALDHPCICTIYELDRVDNKWFIAMALVEGETLAERIHAGGLPIEEAIKIASAVAHGLQAAHSRGVVHRDIKAKNIMVTNERDVKILDFGIAKVNWQPGITQFGAIVGSPAYMSPEQLQGLPVDHRTDLWSLGVVFYEMLTGNLPFQGDNWSALQQAILHETPAPLRQLRPEIQPAIEQIVGRALTREPDQRYQAASQMRADLLRIPAHSASPGAVSVSSSQSPTRTSSARNQVSSIVVLPFVNIPPDPENEYFSDGLTAELINSLAEIPNLRVLSRTSSFALKGRQGDLSQFADLLHVEAALEGTIRKAGNRLRVLLQLVQLRDGFQLWAGKFSAELKDLFELQEQLANSVVEALKIKLAPEVEASLHDRYAGNFNAYNEYLQGQYHVNRMSPISLQKSHDHFEQALKLDANYAPAYAGLALYYGRLAFYNAAPPPDVLPRALAAARRAITIDNRLAEAHATLGEIVLYLDWDWAGAERECLEAIRMNPNTGSVREFLPILLARQGRLDEAYEHVMEALKLDPLSMVLRDKLAYLYYYAQEYERAIEVCNKALEIDPTFVFFRGCKHLCYVELGNNDRALDELREENQTCGLPVTNAFLSGFLARSGNEAEARQLLGGLLETERHSYVAPTFIAIAYIGFGEFDNAFQWLEKACYVHDPTVTYLGVLRTFDPLRSDPRFPDLLRKVGLPASMRPENLHLHAKQVKDPTRAMNGM